jgi:hypothetical protein
MNKIGILIALVLSGCASHEIKTDKYDFSDSYSYASDFEYMQNLDYQKSYEQSQVQAKTKIGLKYITTSLLDKHNFHWRSLAPKCYEQYKASIESFDMVLAISSNGEVLEIVATKDADFVACFTSEIKKITYPEPPFKNFYFYINAYTKT